MPSKKILIGVCGAAVLVFAVGFFAFPWKKEGEKVSVKNSDEPYQKEIRELSLDYDNDGLKNWEETLWKTDSRKADSDGDGTNDNDEILAKRSPTKAAPGDEFSNVPDGSSLAAEGEETSRSESPIDSLAKNFAAEYFQQKFLSGSDPGNPLDISGFNSKILTDLTKVLQEQHFTPADKYTERDFPLRKGDSTEEIKQYANNLGSFLKNNEIPKDKQEVAIISEATKKQDFEKLKDLETSRDAYTAMAEGMKAIPVPSSLLPAHTEMANSFWRTAQILDAGMQADTDSVKAITALNAYPDEVSKSVEPLKDILAQIKIRHITFTAEEGGSIFNAYAAVF